MPELESTMRHVAQRIPHPQTWLRSRTPWTSLACLIALASVGCTVDEIPEGLKRTPDGNGPEVRFNLYHKPLPEIPMPNDVAMWPDPTSRTGLRINASIVAPTEIEETARKKFDQLEGWGTFAQRREGRAQTDTLTLRHGRLRLRER